MGKHSGICVNINRAPEVTADTNGHRPMPQPFHLKNFCLCL